jgi:ubiquinone/menaquinone biosynthesis C-methylase UbiE
VRRFILVLLALALVSAPALAQEKEQPPQKKPAQSRPAHEIPDHSFADVDRWVRIFDNPGRDEWQMPGRVVEALKLGPGSVAADLGAGTGYFTMHLARAVAPGGKVLAIDTEPNMVEYLGKRAEHDGVTGVEPVLADPDDPHIPPGSAHRILIVDTYHHIHDRVDYLRRLEGALAEGGQVVVIDYFKKPLPVGPPVDFKMSRDHVVEEFEEAGYRLASEETFLPYQYFLLFEPAGD